MCVKLEPCSFTSSLCLHRLSRNFFGVSACLALKICADTSRAFTLFRICESKAPRAYKQNQEYKYEEQNGAVIIKNIAEKTTVGHSKTPPHYIAHQCKRLLCYYYKYIPERFNRLQKQSVTVSLKIWRSIKRVKLKGRRILTD